MPRRGPEERDLQALGEPRGAPGGGGRREGGVCFKGGLCEGVKSLQTSQQENNMCQVFLYTAAPPPQLLVSGDSQVRFGGWAEEGR